MSIWQQMASGNSSSASSADSAESANARPRGTVTTCQLSSRVFSTFSQARMNPRQRASIEESMDSDAAEQAYTMCLWPRLSRCWVAVYMPFSSSILMEASNPSMDGVLMPMIGTRMRLSCSTSFSSMAKDATNTASTLRRTGRSVKNLRRMSAVSMCWKTEMS